MKTVSLWRAFKEGFVSFGRNGWLSLATVSVVVLSLYVVSFIFFIVIVGNQMIGQFQDKINVSVYFDIGADEERILEVKNELEMYPEIKTIDYVSRNQALDNFRENNKDNPIVLQSLEVVEGNPFMASLVIKARNSEQYESIAQTVEQNYKEDVSRINYGKNKEIIDKLNSIIKSVEKFGLGIGLLFVLISVLITFNTIRITMYNHKQEIEIKRLVGASNWYIRMPYIFEGIIYSVIASIVTTLLMYGTVYFTSSAAARSLPGVDLKSLFMANLAEIYLLSLGLGVLLGIISSFIAIRRYLKT